MSSKYSVKRYEPAGMRASTPRASRSVRSIVACVAARTAPSP
jgi:hypothetical protein